MNPTAATGASPSSHRKTRPHRFAFVALAACALIYAWGCMAAISRNDPWYRNTDMDMHNLVDALAINSGVAPVGIDQPALPTKYFLALDFRIRHHLGVLSAWNLEGLAASVEPLDEIRSLIHIERIHSRVLVIFFILAAAGLVYAVTELIEPFCLAVILLAGNSGVLFHGLLSRPDLFCVGFGAVLAVRCAWLATSARSPLLHSGWLFLAGIFCGLSFLSKLPGLLYLPACYVWCWLAALHSGSRIPEPAATSNGRTTRFGLLPAGVGVATLWLVDRLMQTQAVFSATASLRLRLVATTAALLPVLPLVGRPRGWGRFLLARGHELAVLGGGALASLLLGYGSLRAVMPGPAADSYLAHVLQLMFDPDPLMKYFLGATPNAAREFLSFVKEAPFLFAGGAAAAGLSLLRSAPRLLRLFCLLLLLLGVGMALLLSRRYFLDQFSVYAHVPLLLVWPVILFALGVWRPKEGAGAPWAIPVLLAAASVILLSAYFQLRPKYTAFQPDVALPVNELTLTFIYAHNAHPQKYRQIMQDHYGDRKSFAAKLNEYLADPAHRQ